jgi:hypothetical protein
VAAAASARSAADRPEDDLVTGAPAAGATGFDAALRLLSSASARFEAVDAAGGWTLATGGDGGGLLAAAGFAAGCADTEGGGGVSGAVAGAAARRVGGEGAAAGGGGMSCCRQHSIRRPPGAGTMTVEEPDGSICGDKERLSVTHAHH